LGDGSTTLCSRLLSVCSNEIPTALLQLSLRRQPGSIADLVSSARREMAGIAVRAMPRVNRPAAVSRIDSPRHERALLSRRCNHSRRTTRVSRGGMSLASARCIPRF